MANKLFEHVRQDTCIFCNTDKAIELYDKNNNPVRFSSILDSGRIFLLNIRDIRYGQCKYCNKKFFLDWSLDRNIPRPLLDINFKNYLQQYSKSKVV